MNRRPIRLAALALALALAGLALGQQLISTGKYLYTAPDASATGGIKGKIVNPMRPVIGVYALPPDEPRFVYKAALSGPDNREFSFTGLPMAKYDLLVLYNDCFYEGLRLCREDDTLTSKDREGIETIIKKTEAFFPDKVIYRMAGTTGDGNEARAITTFFRAKSSDDLAGNRFNDFRWSVKLVVLMDVGPGWQVSRTREIYVDFIKKELGMPKSYHAPGIGGIRVTDAVKDLGEVDLTKARSGGR